jgi:signal peptidase I
VSLRPPSSSEPAEARDEDGTPPSERPAGSSPPPSPAPSPPPAAPDGQITPAADPRATAPGAGVPASSGQQEPSRTGLGPDGGFVGRPAGRGGGGTATATKSAKPTMGVPQDRGGKHRGDKKGPLSFLRELPALIIIAFLLALLIKSFLVQAFFIPSVSMEPTLKVGDRVLVNKLAYKFHPPGRGDVIVFSNPEPGTETHRGVISGFFHWVTEGLGFTAPQDEDFIKRVVGLPGDVVEERNGIIYVNNKALYEPYLSPAKDNRTLGPWTVRPDHLFVLGDNRSNSNDSRFAELGQIPMDKVIGRAFIIIWPPGDFGGLSDGTRFALAFP